MATKETTRQKHRTTSVPKPPRKRKFMQTLSLDTYRTIETVARKRGVSVQELLRAQIIPDWLRANRQQDR